MREPGHVLLETGSTMKFHKRRWRLAIIAISFTRALCCLAKNVEKKANLIRSLSYIAIDIHPSPSIPPVDPAAITHETLSFPHNIDAAALADIVRSRNLDSLTNQYRGVEGLVKTLETDAENGISSTDSDLIRRKNAFGVNRYQKPLAKGFLPLVRDALLKIVFIMLFGVGSQDQGRFDVDGMTTIFVVFILLSFSSASNLRRSRVHARKISPNNSSDVRVTRGGQAHMISMYDIVVGDIVHLKIGDRIPADGLFLERDSWLNVDESCMTGESVDVEINAGSNPFMLSGTKVVDGTGTMVVTAVGMNTAWGEVTSSVVSCGDYGGESTPLQARLKQLTSNILKVGMYATALILVGLIVCFLMGHTSIENGGDHKYSTALKTKYKDLINSILRITAAAMATLVVGIPEGLHLAVTLISVYSMTKMDKDNTSVQNLTACETMGSTTMICTDKTGTLTLNEMQVIEVCLGNQTLKSEEYGASEMPPGVVSLLRESVGLIVGSGSVGSPTDKAIHSWAISSLGLDTSDELRPQGDMIVHEAFNSKKRRSGVLFRRSHEKSLQVHWKGAAEVILAMCSSYYDKNGVIRAMHDKERRQMKSVIQNLAAKSLRCIAFAHKKIEGENGQNIHEELEESGLTFLALAGLTNPCRQRVKETIDACIAAGVEIKMVTGDNVHTARAIAIECGILRPEHEEILDCREAVIEGAQFRALSPEEQKRKVEKIRVMARSSPFEKRLMIECLKRKGHRVVAFIGDGTNDAPALKEAHVGISMGSQGTEVANESADIVILDDKIYSVVTILKWGRCVYENIQKFIQFQLTMNLAALVFNFVASVSSGKVPLTAIQILWANLIMDTLAALALATEQPTEELMKKRPVGLKESLITRIMWRNLIGQALFQVTVLVTVQFKGRSIFGLNEKVNNTLIFNTFVLCQVFNEFNARKLENKNIFEGIHKNKLFLGIIGITVVFQVLTLEFLNKFYGDERLSWELWGASVGIAASSWPIGLIVKCIPVSGYWVMRLTSHQDLHAKKV